MYCFFLGGDGDTLAYSKNCEVSHNSFRKIIKTGSNMIFSPICHVCAGHITPQLAIKANQTLLALHLLPNFQYKLHILNLISLILQIGLSPAHSLIVRVRASLHHTAQPKQLSSLHPISHCTLERKLYLNLHFIICLLAL